jgi:hypothetical protein
MTRVVPHLQKSEGVNDSTTIDSNESITEKKSTVEKADPNSNTASPLLFEKLDISNFIKEG